MRCIRLKTNGKSINIGEIKVEDGCLVFSGQETIKFKLSEADLNNQYVESFIKRIYDAVSCVTIWYGIDDSRTAYNGDIIDFQVYENNMLVKGLMIDYIQ